VDGIPAALREVPWQEWTIDATHSNVWHDQSKAELTRTAGGTASGTTFTWSKTLGANSITLLELQRP
jgi:hypothetical protein